MEHPGTLFGFSSVGTAEIVEYRSRCNWPGDVILEDVAEGPHALVWVRRSMIAVGFSPFQGCYTFVAKAGFQGAAPVGNIRNITPNF